MQSKKAKEKKKIICKGINKKYKTETDEEKESTGSTLKY